MPVPGQHILHIDSLQKALMNGLVMVREHDESRQGHAFAEAFSNLVASVLDGVRITSMPPTDLNMKHLPFDGNHRIRAESLFVARGGMRGGPTIDLLVQVCFDTEDTVCGFGTPILFRSIPSEGRMPEQTWKEVREISAQVVQATPSGRIVLLPEDGGPFENNFLQAWADSVRLCVMDMSSFAGSVIAPKPLRGRGLPDFCLDLASGWTGDPALSGMSPSAILDEFLATFDVASVLRIRVEREDRSPIWKDVELPF